MDVRVRVAQDHNSPTQVNTEKESKIHMDKRVKVAKLANSQTEETIEKPTKSPMDVRVELALVADSHSELFLETESKKKHRMTGRRLSKCVAGLVLVLLLAGHVAVLAYAYHQNDQSELLWGIGTLCSVLLLLLTHGHGSLLRAWVAVHVTYSDDLASYALTVLNDLQAKPLLHALGLDPAHTLDTLAYWWWFLQGLLLATLASFISGSSADDNNPDDDPDPDLDPVSAFVEVNMMEVMVALEAEQKNANVNSESESVLRTHNSNTRVSVKGIMSCLSHAIKSRPYRFVACLLLLVLLGVQVAILAYAYHQDHDTDLLWGMAALCSVLALLLTHGRVSMSRAWLAVHVTYSDDLAHGALSVLNDLQAQPLLHALSLHPPDTLETLAYWWWVLQGLVLATLASFISGHKANVDDNLDNDHDAMGDEGQPKCSDKNHVTFKGMLSCLSRSCLHLHNTIMRRPYRCFAGLLLLLLLAGHVAVLAHAYHQDKQSDFLWGIAALCSVISLLPLALLLPSRSSSLRRAWLAVHVTYSDDLAQAALHVLKDLQVQPVLHALGLGPADTLATLAYWWWVLQGLLLATLASFISETNDDNPDNDPDPEVDPVVEENEFEDVELNEVVVVVETVEGRVGVRAVAPPPNLLVHHPLAEEEGGREEEIEEVDRREVVQAVEGGHLRLGGPAAPPHPQALRPQAEEEAEHGEDLEELNRRDVVELMEEGRLMEAVNAAAADRPAVYGGVE